jgi:hypothetical protein
VFKIGDLLVIMEYGMVAVVIKKIKFLASLKGLNGILMNTVMIAYL